MPGSTRQCHHDLALEALTNHNQSDPRSALYTPITGAGPGPPARRQLHLQRPFPIELQVQALWSCWRGPRGGIGGLLDYYATGFFYTSPGYQAVFGTFLGNLT